MNWLKCRNSYSVYTGRMVNVSLIIENLLFLETFIIMYCYRLGKCIIIMWVKKYNDKLIDYVEKDQTKIQLTVNIYHTPLLIWYCLVLWCTNTVKAKQRRTEKMILATLLCYKCESNIRYQNHLTSWSYIVRGP